MKTLNNVLLAIEKGKDTQCMDGRDFSRLCRFFPVDQWPKLGFEYVKEEAPPKPVKWTRGNILSQLKRDLDFAFEKAINKRGISSSLMFEVIKMWMWVLEDLLQDNDDYPMYGLPLYKAVALKYGFPNQIGDDSGREEKYNG